MAPKTEPFWQAAVTAIGLALFVLGVLWLACRYAVAVQP
jgi:hypothetical protein